VEAITSLYKGIRAVAPAAQGACTWTTPTGHHRPAPGVCKAVMKAIVKYHTPGDVAAFGMESADPTS